MFQKPKFSQQKTQVSMMKLMMLIKTIISDGDSYLGDDDVDDDDDEDDIIENQL